MMRFARSGLLLVVASVLVLTSGTRSLRAGEGDTIVPNGWVLHRPPGTMAEIGTMPQGAALSRDGHVLAIVESGFNPPALRLLRSSDLHQIAAIPLAGAMGRPVWRDARHVVVAGANADAVFDVDTASRRTRAYRLAAKSYPLAVALARDGITFAVATEGDGAVRTGTLAQLRAAKPVKVGDHPGALAFSRDAATVFVSVRSRSYVRAVQRRTGAFADIAVGLHPGDLLMSADGVLYVAESDADAVGVIDPASRRRVRDIFVGDRSSHGPLFGVSVNALAMQGTTLYASLGAANSVAVIRHDRVVGRLDAGWYPTDVVPAGGRLFVVDGKGERARPNPGYHPKSTHDYVAAIEVGSVRAYDVAAQRFGGNPQGAAGWAARPQRSIVRKGGPIRHVFFILKENRSYDQVLGDMPDGNGDPNLVWFGQTVTPNQHALAERFGLFDNTYASGEVSDSGHKWANSSFANDYAERTWPPAYGNRRDQDDIGSGEPAGIPHGGFLWDAAARAHVSFRDYGELVDHPKGPRGPGTTTAPTLRGRFDPRYVGWDLDYSDLDRVKEWRREFDDSVAHGTTPQLELIYLPNDHTYGSRAGKPTPVAFVATNDYAVGLVIEAISHSRIWGSSAVFVIEDDAQDGPDHVSDQRTTLYLASPYARGGVQHAHYSTVSVIRTIELMLGMDPLSTYDGMAVPLDAAFTREPNLQPFDALAPTVDVNETNKKTAFGARASAAFDFSHPDAAPPRALLNVLAHNHG
jgi:DNA-binding beta-propeller fold protein YncE